METANIEAILHEAVKTKSFYSMWLEPIVTGIYRKTVSPCIGSSEGLQKAIRDTDAAYDLPLPARGAEFLMERIAKDLGSGLRALYGLNVSLAEDGVLSLLSGAPLHVSPDSNVAVDDMPGINIPTYYLGTRASFTEMHVEDGFLDSLNVLRWGREKLWIVVHPHFYNDLETRLATCLHTRGGTKAQDWLPGCATPTHHKALVLLPGLLRHWGIPFEVILQSPGDLVYIGCGVAHQVINLGPNFCEAVNVGSGAWKESGHTFVSCSCPGRVLQYIEVPPLGKYGCELPGCPSEAVMLEAERRHALPHKGRVTYDWLECDKTYLTAAALQEHKSRVHSKTPCPRCDKLVARNNLQRHLSTHREQGGAVCGFCHIHFPVAANARRHAARCPKKPK